MKKPGIELRKPFLFSSGASSIKKTNSQSVLDKQDNKNKINNVCNSDINLKNKIENELQRLKYYSSNINKIKYK